MDHLWPTNCYHLQTCLQKQLRVVRKYRFLYSFCMTISLFAHLGLDTKNFPLDLDDDQIQSLASKYKTKQMKILQNRMVA